LYGFASALSRLGLAGGLGIWPVNSPLVAQLLIVITKGKTVCHDRVSRTERFYRVFYSRNPMMLSLARI
jgi:hypothetical protein